MPLPPKENFYASVLISVKSAVHADTTAIQSVLTGYVQLLKSVNS